MGKKNTKFFFVGTMIVGNDRKKFYKIGSWSLSYKTFLADIVVIYDIILTLEKSASIAIVMYENKIELLSKQKKS